MTSVSGNYEPVHWAECSLEQLHPEGAERSHPLMLLAQGLNRQLRVKADGQFWLIKPGFPTKKAEGETLSKKVLTLDFNFSTL